MGANGAVLCEPGEEEERKGKGRRRLTGGDRRSIRQRGRRGGGQQIGLSGPKKMGKGLGRERIRPKRFQPDSMEIVFLSGVILRPLKVCDQEVEELLPGVN